MRRISWLVVTSLMTLSLVVAACGPAATPAAPAVPAAPVAPGAPVEEKAQKEAVAPAASADVPKYGGTLNLAQGGDVTAFDDIVSRRVLPGATFNLTNEPMWITDWAKGIAGGYGTAETDLRDFQRVIALRVGLVAESWKWSVDWAKNSGTVVFQIRPGIRYALNPNSEASRLVNGRELTADDVVFSFTQLAQAPTSTYASNTTRQYVITKTAPWEVTISNIPAASTLGNLQAFGESYGRIVPPEVVKKYGDMSKWQNSVGTGPYMLIDYVPGSLVRMQRNSNYWKTDPVGPGKGNKLPYLDEVRYLIIPDASTRQAAMRTGKVDQTGGVGMDDLDQYVKWSPNVKSVRQGSTGPPGIGKFPIQMRQDKPPFNDIRVRQAMLLAIDFQAIDKALYRGVGKILTWPREYSAAYADSYLALDAPDMPASVKELFTYTPDNITKAKQLLKEAGYPNGIKTTALMTQTEVDYWSILKDMWSKAGIEVVFDVRESLAKTEFTLAKRAEGLVASGFMPNTSYSGAMILQTNLAYNFGMVSDPVIDETLPKIVAMDYTDQKEAMRMSRELSKHILLQSYAIPTVYGPTYAVWWPWLKNYSGEANMGFHWGGGWVIYVWLDEALKKSMGY